MPSNFHPITADFKRDLIIELHGFDSRTANRRYTDNSCPVLAPAKMLTPNLRTRVEERDEFAFDRINSFDLIALEPVTQPARETEVPLFAAASA